MFQRIKTLLEEHEWIIPLSLFVAFLGFTLPGIAWGAPSVWHPDEIVVRSIKALYGEWRFSEINFDYPDLPQYAMYFLGKLFLALGQTNREILIGSRVLSALLAGLTILLVYIIARRMGGSVLIAGLAGLLLLCVSELSHNGRFAHNDSYVTFFTTLAILFLILYHLRTDRVWLYASFFTVGLAASSKYIGGSLIIAPLLVYLFEQKDNFHRNKLAALETLFISGALAYLGFAFGTPKALTWMAFYFKRLFTTLQFQINYNRRPDSIRGIVGQYGVLADGLGIAIVLLLGAGFLWGCYQVLKAQRAGNLTQGSRAGAFAILLLGILSLDLPMMASFNYQLRYFLPLMPLLAILTAFFISDIYTRARQAQKSLPAISLAALVTLIIIYSLSRNLSMTLLFVNDSRIPASEYVKTLPFDTSLEHTNYGPSLPEDHFEREHNYPVHFILTADAPLPTDKPYEFNQAEQGLLDRGTTYLVVDNFTIDKFNDPLHCELMSNECEFFRQLETGMSEHYQMIAEFEYKLPPYLPQIEVLFANPTIRIYERIP
ncbi:MAG TPA: phospholipid carrier-dependent glycosyltransferase [Anaerolineales bacterium]|nr:phospholipid carrier-dependent glycosyltransferase [Anaerolineales bacterium]